MRACSHDFSQKLFPLNITTTTNFRLQRTFLQPYRMAQTTPSVNTSAENPIQPKPNSEADKIEIPPPPEKPEPGDCCGSGCVRCVWDVYYDELEEYNKLYKQPDPNPKP